MVTLQLACMLMVNETSNLVTDAMSIIEVDGRPELGEDANQRADHIAALLRAGDHQALAAAIASRRRKHGDERPLRWSDQK